MDALILSWLIGLSGRYSVDPCVVCSKGRQVDALKLHAGGCLKGSDSGSFDVSHGDCLGSNDFRRAGGNDFH